jgi:hypothetical protein
MTCRIEGRRLLITGSISPATSRELALTAHEIVREVTRGVLGLGGGVVACVGKEPIGSENGTPLIFDWTVLETVREIALAGHLPWPNAESSPIVVVGSEAALSQVPTARQDLWSELLRLNLLKVEMILPGARSGALLRIRQAEHADVLMCLGGATGVEHLAEVFLNRRRPVIPLDLMLGASRGDGTGGSERLAERSRSFPAAFVRTKKGYDAGAMLARVATYGAKPDQRMLSDGVLAVIDALELPDAFCVRLINPKHPDYSKVQAFFSGVVHPVLSQMRMNVIDLNSTVTTEPFLNVEVFRSLHFSDFVLVDLTGSRPNCFIELGYALGRPLPFTITCEAGTAMPFDPDAIPRHEWHDGAADDERQAKLHEHILRNIGRRPLVGS